MDSPLDYKKQRPHNKNYMSIAVSVLTTSCVARKSGGAARQGRSPQSATAYSSVRYRQVVEKEIHIGKSLKDEVRKLYQ